MKHKNDEKTVPDILKVIPYIALTHCVWNGLFKGVESSPLVKSNYSMSLKSISHQRDSFMEELVLLHASGNWQTALMTSVLKREYTIQYHMALLNTLI